MGGRDRGHGRELEAIRAIARTRRTDDIAELSSEMQVIAARSTDSERAAIYLVDPEKQQLVMAATPYGYDGPLAQQYRCSPLDGPMMGNVLRTRTPLVFGAASLPESLRAKVLAAGFVEFAIVPLHDEDILTGTLNLARTRPEPYHPDTVHLALALGEQISTQIERARLYIEARERGHVLARLNDDLRRSCEDLARAQTELIRTERLASLGELAALVAHEVRNPLGVVFNVVSQLRKLIPPEPREAAQLVGILQQEANRLDRIVRDFLHFGRPKCPEVKPVDIASLVDTAIELTTLALENSQVTWRIELSSDAPRVDGDAHLLRQVLVNLLTNAAEAQTPAGIVWVRTYPGQQDGRSHIRLVIENEGIALRQEILDRAFEPFYTTKASGTGLGLAIARGIVEAHGGQISIGHREAGGTIVTLTLPVRASSARTEGKRIENRTD
jgi:signal transduction histidine kinase